MVQERQPDGVTDLGLTLPGFLLFFSLFIERGRPEAAWAILRKCGYNDSLELSTELLPVPAKQSPDQVCAVLKGCDELAGLVLNRFCILFLCFTCRALS